MKIFLLFYMCHFAMGLTHCYKTTVFLHLSKIKIKEKYTKNKDKILTRALVMCGDYKSDISPLCTTPGCGCSHRQ